jgi:hypothetical protein
VLVADLDVAGPLARLAPATDASVEVALPGAAKMSLFNAQQITLAAQLTLHFGIAKCLH